MRARFLPPAASLGTLLVLAAAPAAARAQDPAADFRRFDVSGNGYLTGPEIERCGCSAAAAAGARAVSLDEYLRWRGAGGRAGAAVPAAPPVAARPAAAAAPAPVAAPPRPGFVGGRPVGLYYMQRRAIVTGGLEQTIWYFAPDGRVYEDVTTGVSAAELAAHKAGSQGTVSVTGDQMTITWGGGYKPTTTAIERGPEGFYWNMGSYLAIQPFRDPRAIAGRYAGGTSVTFSGTSTAVQKTLTLRPDGTFTWEGISSTTGDGYRAGGQGGSAGTWAASAYALALRAADGTVTRAFAFPWDDAKTPAYPDRLYFAGVMYTRQ